jgi:hypothetical protein
MRTFDRISGDASIELLVTHVGSNPLGAPFRVALVGAATFDMLL